MKLKNKLIPITISAALATIIPTSTILTSCSKKNGIDPTKPYTPSIQPHDPMSVDSIEKGLDEYIKSIDANIDILKQDIYWTDSLSWAKSDNVQSSCSVVIDSISVDKTAKTFSINYSSNSWYRFEPTAELKLVEYSFSENIQLFNMPLSATYVDSPFESITQKLWCFAGTSQQSSWNADTKIIGSEKMKIIKQTGEVYAEYEIDNKEVTKTTDIEKDIEASEVVTMGDMTAYSYHFKDVKLV